MKTNDRRQELASWRFMIDQHAYGESHHWMDAEHDHSGWMEVPAGKAWDHYDYAMRNYEGGGWYYTEFDAFSDEEVHHFIDFDGIGGDSKIFVNGTLVHEDFSRYLPVIVDVEDAIVCGQKNSVAVYVDNTFHPKDRQTGGKKIEWVLYGGLTHRIHLRGAKNCRVEHSWIRAEADGTLSAEITVKNDGHKAFRGKLNAHVADCAASAIVTCKAGETATVHCGMTVKDVKTWSPDAPNLYDFHIELTSGKTILHTATERIGFRTIERRGSEIYFNGAPIFFKGVNRYDEYEPYGNLPPEALIREDLTNIKRCGMNFIRTHYEQDEIHYDLADELGLFYMLEVPLNWWRPEDGLTLADFPVLEREAVDNLNRTFYHFCNHPCWVVWSTSNECWHSHPACQEMFRMLTERMRAYDSGRLLTTVTSSPVLDDKELDFCDVISINRYCRSDIDDMEQMGAETADACAEAICHVQALYPDHPIVVTEFGHVSVPGLRAGGAHISEEHCAAYVTEVVRGFSRAEHLRGLVLWSWADYFHRWCYVLTKTPTMHIRAPFGAFGVVTVDRRIKTTPFDTVRRLMDQFE